MALAVPGAVKRFYFQGYCGCGTWRLDANIVSTEAFDASLALAKDAAFFSEPRPQEGELQRALPSLRRRAH